MREILFRGQRLFDKEWVYGLLYRGIDGEYHIQTEEGFNFAINGDTVGQYTGFTDYDGRKIFEGDIVSNGYDGKDVVKFCTEDVASCGCCYPYFTGSGFKADGIDLDHCAVVGNIYENEENQEENAE